MARAMEPSSLHERAPLRENARLPNLRPLLPDALVARNPPGPGTANVVVPSRTPNTYSPSLASS
eukprot:10244988-Lingulodinium_polyedra.AAC.1